MVPRPLAPARAMRSRTCAHVIQPCRLLTVCLVELSGEGNLCGRVGRINRLRGCWVQFFATWHFLTLLVSKTRCHHVIFRPQNREFIPYTQSRYT